MKVLVEVLTGRLFHVEVEDQDATVGSLKKAIVAMGEEEMPPEQRLLLVLGNGRLLVDDGSALAEAGVRDGSVVYLFFTSIGDPNWLPSLDDHVV